VLVFSDRLDIGRQPLDERGSVGQAVILACGKRGADPCCRALADFREDVAITHRLAELCYDLSPGGGIERACRSGRAWWGCALGRL
jgi:hypothetical protein